MGVSAAALWTAIAEGVGGAAVAAGAEGAAGAVGATAGGTAAVTGTAATAGYGSAIATGVAGAATGALLSAALAPKMPGQKPPTSLPSQSAVEEAKRRSILLQRQRAGRESTILSQGDGGTLG